MAVNYRGILILEKGELKLPKVLDHGIVITLAPGLKLRTGVPSFAAIHPL
jgi:hypothetical protein